MQAPSKAVAKPVEALAFGDDSDGDGEVEEEGVVMEAEDSDGEDDAATRAANPALRSNESFLKSRTVSRWSSDDDEEDEKEESDEEPEEQRGHQPPSEAADVAPPAVPLEQDDELPMTDTQQQEPGISVAPDRHGEHSSDVPDAAETGRLFVRNLPYAAGEDDVRAYFETVAAVKSVHVVLDRATKKSKGVAFVEFEVADDAALALEQLDGCIFQGRLLHVLPARAAPAAVPSTPDQVLHGDVSAC